MMESVSVRAVARWSILLLGLGLALVYLNSAAFSGWASGGPPTEIPAAWKQRALAHLCYGLSALLLGFALFRALRPSRLADPGVWIAIALGVVFLAVPSVRQFIEIDQCLDAGGCWNRNAFKCEFISQEACSGR
jgi:hypothetical protein